MSLFTYVKPMFSSNASAPIHLTQLSYRNEKKDGGGVGLSGQIVSDLLKLCSRGKL